MNEEKKEYTESLEESFKKIQEDQSKQIEELTKKLEERDNLIRQYMTNPSKTADNDSQDESLFTSEDIKKVVELVKIKRS